MRRPPESCVYTVVRDGKKWNLRRVDDSGHSALAMCAGGTIIPERASIVDGNGVDGGRHARSNGDVPREETFGLIEWLARLREAGLRDVVGFRPEVELDLTSKLLATTHDTGRGSGWQRTFSPT